MTARVKNSASTPAPALENVAPVSTLIERASVVRRKSGARAPAQKLNEITQAKLPHERDESVSAAGAEPSAPMQQAFEDLARGLQDTDRGAEAGRTYKKLKR